MSIRAKRLQLEQERRAALMARDGKSPREIAAVLSGPLPHQHMKKSRAEDLIRRGEIQLSKAADEAAA